MENQPVEYGLSLAQFNSHKENETKSLYFLHGTTWETKLWPEKYWIELGEIAARNSYSINLLWGNEEEQLRAKRIAKAIPGANVMSQLTLTEIASQLMQTDIVIAVDTGLAHLSAALERPTIALYGASDPEKTGTYGKNQVHLSALFSCSPCLNKKCNYQSKDLNELEKQTISTVNPPCFSTLPPGIVWQKVAELINTQH